MSYEALKILHTFSMDDSALMFTTSKHTCSSTKPLGVNMLFDITILGGVQLNMYQL